MKKNNVIIIISCVVSSIFTGIITFFITSYKKNSNVNVSISKENKFKQYYHLANQWLLLKNENKSVADYLLLNGYKEIAIYGMGELGNRLYEELIHTNVKINYAIDKYPESGFPNLQFYELCKDLKDVDLIIVTPVFDYDAIEKSLKENVDYPIKSLEDILYNI